MMPLRSLLLGLTCVWLLLACEPGNSLKSFSGRELRTALRLPSENGTRTLFVGELILRAPEYGCLQLHPGVTATLSDIPLQVTPGIALTRDGPCGKGWPSFFDPLDIQLFLGEPRNAVLEIRDGDDRIVAEFTNFFARHSFAQVSPAPTVKPGEEIFLPWDPPTDDLSIIEEVALGTPGKVVPARPEAGGLRITIPADFPAGSTVVSARASDIPAERCEGVATCTASSLAVHPRVVQITVQP
jgi:hypothetical protein